MKKLTNIFIITLAAMLVLSANVCTASAATSGSGNATICVQAQNTFWSRSVTIKQAPGYTTNIVIMEVATQAATIHNILARLLLHKLFVIQIVI